MSGLEALGVAASVIQVADLGTKLSVKLFSFYRQVKNANLSIQNLSSEIALTSAILRELGESLKTEGSWDLCSEEAFKTLKNVLDQCQDVLGQIQRLVIENKPSGKSGIQQVTEKFRLILLEPKLDPLKQNLERLKSTMLLLLNVIMYAGLLKNKNVPNLLQEQRHLLESLVQKKEEDSLSQSSTIQNTCTIPNSNENLDPFNPMKSETKQDSDPMNSHPELKEYSLLIQKMLREIDCCKHKLENTRHSRIKTGILNIHSGEIVRFQMQHGNSIPLDYSLFAENNIQSIPPKGPPKVETEDTNLLPPEQDVLAASSTGESTAASSGGGLRSSTTFGTKNAGTQCSQMGPTGTILPGDMMPHYCGLPPTDLGASPPPANFPWNPSPVFNDVDFIDQQDWAPLFYDDSTAGNVSDDQFDESNHRLRDQRESRIGSAYGNHSEQARGQQSQDPPPDSVSIASVSMTPSPEPLEPVDFQFPEPLAEGSDVDADAEESDGGAIQKKRKRVSLGNESQEEDIPSKRDMEKLKKLEILLKNSEQRNSRKRRASNLLHEPPPVPRPHKSSHQLRLNLSSKQSRSPSLSSALSSMKAMLSQTESINQTSMKPGAKSQSTVPDPLAPGLIDSMTAHSGPPVNTGDTRYQLEPHEASIEPMPSSDSRAAIFPENFAGQAVTGTSGVTHDEDGPSAALMDLILRWTSLEREEILVH